MKQENVLWGYHNYYFLHNYVYQKSESCSYLLPLFNYELNYSYFSLFLFDKTNIERKIKNHCLLEVIKNVKIGFHKSSYEMKRLDHYV